MGRKSLEIQRTQQLLEAFIACIPEHGIQGATLDHIAAKAGMTRSIIRHYVGNRDELIDKLIDYVVQLNLDEFERAFSQPTSNRVERLLNALFETREDTLSDRLILEVLIHVKEQFPEGTRKVVQLVERLVALITREILLAYPHAGRAEAERVAYTLFCISLSQDSLVWLGISPTLTSQAPEMAYRILQTLAAAPTEEE